MIDTSDPVTASIGRAGGTGVAVAVGAALVAVAGTVEAAGAVTVKRSDSMPLIVKTASPAGVPTGMASSTDATPGFSVWAIVVPPGSVMTIALPPADALSWRTTKPPGATLLFRTAPAGLGAGVGVAVAVAVGVGVAVAVAGGVAVGCDAAVEAGRAT